MRPAVLLLLCVLCGTAHAQIVNVQGALAKAPARNTVDGQVELKLGWSEGNAPTFDVAGAGSVVWKHDDFLTLAQASGEYGTALHVVNTKKTFEHLRERITLSQHWRWEAFAQHEYDRFRRLSLRMLVGTGPALQIINQTDYALLVGASYMFELEELDTRDGATDSGSSYTEQRLNAYVTGHQKVVENVAFVQTLYVQPRFDAVENYRLLGEAALQVKLSKRFAITDGFVVAYDSRPPQLVRGWDTTLRVGVVVTL